MDRPVAVGKNKHISSLLAKPGPEALIIPAMDVLGRRSAEPGRSALGMGGRRGIWDEWVGVKKAIATLHMHSQPRSKGWGEGGEFSSRVGASGRGDSDFGLGPRNYRIDIPNTQPIFMTMSSTPPYVY